MEESHKEQDEPLRAADVPEESPADASSAQPQPEPRRRWGGYGGQERIGDFGERLRAYRSGNFSPGVPVSPRLRPPLGRYGRDASPQDPRGREYTGRPTVWQPDRDAIEAKPGEPPPKEEGSERSWLRPRTRPGKPAPEEPRQGD
jgi:hypothetical protein